MTDLIVVRKGAIGAAIDAALAAAKGTPGGVADLDGDGLLPAPRLPAHKARHSLNGSDPLSPADIGAVPNDDLRLSDARTPVAHDHDARYWTELEADARYARGTRTILTQAPLTGGGDLQGDRTLGLADVAGLTPGTYQRATITVDAKGRVLEVSQGAEGAVADASNSQKGASRLSFPPANAADPVALAANDPAYAGLLAARRRSVPNRVPVARLAASATTSFSAAFPASKAVDGEVLLDTSSGAEKGWITTVKALSQLTTDSIDVVVGPMFLVMLGDSITAGGPAHHPTDPSVLRFGEASEDPYHSIQVHLQQMQGRFVANRGVHGDTTAMMLSRLAADVHSVRPAFCFVLGGTNDVNQSVAPATTQSNLQAMYDSLVANGTVPVPCTIPPMNSTAMNAITAAQKQAVLDLNAWIRGRAQANGWPLVDYYAVLDDPANPGSMRVAETDDMGLHPNVAGYARMATAFDPMLGSLSQAPRLVSIGLASRLGNAPASYAKASSVEVSPLARGQTAGVVARAGQVWDLPARQAIDEIPVFDGGYRWARFRVRFASFGGDQTLQRFAGWGEVIPYVQA